MNLSTILPRSLEKQPAGIIPDSCTLLLSLIMAAHLDRTQARQIGWRGVKPAGETAMTCRVDGSPCIYGIAFIQENFSAAEILEGHFNLYAFPEAESGLLDSYPLSALQIAMHPSYPMLIREFENNLETLSPFLCGQLLLSAPISGTALSLTLDSWVKFRVTVPAGIQANDEWLIKPGGADTNLATFHLLLPLFATLTRTAATIFALEPTLLFSSRPTTGYSISNDGILAENFSAKLRKAFLTAEFVDATQSPFHQQKEQKRIPFSTLTSKRSPGPNLELPLLHIVTGFLGSGKTTFLKQWLDFLHSRERYTGVIQNEFGPVDLDTTLLRDDTIVEALDDGCVCCSLAESLRPGLSRILGNLPAHQFILETTGVANPANVRAELNNLSDLVETGLTICIADVSEFIKNGFPRQGIMLDQLQYSDVIILNKMDMLDPAKQSPVLAEFSSLVAKINPEALVLPAHDGNISFAVLDNLPSAQSNGNLIKKGTFLTHLSDGYEKMGIEFTAPVTGETLKELIRSCGDVSRAKGIIAIAEKGSTIVQFVNGNLSLLPVPGKSPTGLSVIGKNLHLPDSYPCILK